MLFPPRGRVSIALTSDGDDDSYNSRVDASAATNEQTQLLDLWAVTMGDWEPGGVGKPSCKRNSWEGSFSEAGHKMSDFLNQMDRRRVSRAHSGTLGT